MSDKTEEPTPRRLRKARETGDHPVSAAIVQASAFIAGLLLVQGAVRALATRTSELLRSAIAGAPALPPPAVASEVLLLATPVVAASAAAALLASLVQTGGMLSLQKLAPDISRTNPFAGLKGLFSPQRGIGVLRAFLAALLLSVYGASLLYRHGADFAASVGRISLALPLAAELVSRLAWFSAFLGASLAFVDLGITRFAWRKRHRMTKDEVKREHRESEGDPHLKAARRRAHQEVLAGAAIAAVKNATVLIVNPTHLAIALEYEEGSDGAPRVLGQGAGDLARRMLEAAHAYGVPVVRDVPIARALFELEVGEEIPEALYEAVAEILREIWEQSAREPG